jgi:Tfp pilus assembly protein PilN
MSALGTKLSLPRRSGSDRRRPVRDAAPGAESGRKAQGAVELPGVNLLSPSAFERLAVRGLRIRFGIGCLALVAVAAGAWAVQAARVADAEEQLKTEQAGTSRLTERTNVLQPVKTYVAGVEQQKATVAETMASEVYFSKVLTAMSAAAPSGVKIESLDVTLAAPAAAPAPTDGDDDKEQDPPAPVVPSACPGPDPFQTQVVIGCITLSGTAGSRADVGDLVVALGADDSFVEPFITTTTTADASKVSFSGSVGLSKKVFSLRYITIDRLLAGKD